MTKYQGIDKTGAHRQGITTEPAVDLTKRLFNERWTEASVFNDSRSVQLGAIERHPDSGRRMWWANDG